MRAWWPKRRKEKRERKRKRECGLLCMRERAPALWLLFLCFFLPLGLLYVNWASQKCFLFYLRSSLVSLDLPLKKKKIGGLFPSLPCLLATTILDSFFLFEQPNNTKSLQLGLTLCNPMQCSLPGSSIHWILQARISECVAMPSSRRFF